MGLAVLSSQEVRLELIEFLGFNSADYSIEDVEVQTAFLRRAASLLCPCPANALIYSVIEPLRGLVSDLDGYQQQVESNLERLIAHGDLLELSRASEDNDSRTQSVLFLAPPAFVRRLSGAVILLGGLADNVSPLPIELETQIAYSKHVRVLPPTSLADGIDYLKELGFIAIPTGSWLKMPKEESASKHLSKMNRLLDATSHIPSEVHGLRILDSNITSQFYRDRWVIPQNHSGRYVGRRPQAYGADIWCYVELDGGSPVKVLDLPVKVRSWRACDEAWRIQASIDHELGKPQMFKVCEDEPETKVIEFFAPVPMWVSRKLEAIGEPVDRPGCLLSFVIGINELTEEVQFLKNYAWLVEAR